MGGGRYPYPKWVWSTSGWWPHPRNWKANTAAAIFGIALIQYPIFLYGERNLETTINLAEVDRLAEKRRQEILAQSGNGVISNQ